MTIIEKIKKFGSVSYDGYCQLSIVSDSYQFSSPYLDSEVLDIDAVSDDMLLARWQSYVNRLPLIMWNVFDALSLQRICQVSGLGDGSDLYDPRIDAPAHGCVFQKV